MLQVLKEFVPPVIAITVGALVYSSLNRFWRLNLLQCVVYLAVLSGSYIVTPVHSTNSNEWLYNIYILLETSILMLALTGTSSSVQNRLMAIIFYLLFVSAYAIQVVISGLQSFANYAYAVGGVGIVALFVGAIVREVRNDRLHLRNPILWVSMGIIVYFACNVPFVSLYPWLKGFPQEAKVVFSIVNDLFAMLRYLSLAFALFLLKPQLRSTTV